jgi:formylmethanofuran:tetrahydromethanopterin formyltransferase
VAKKLSKRAIEAAIDARIQRAVTGFIIPMMSIPKLSAALKAAIAAGQADEELKAVVAEFPGIVPSNI